MKEGREKKGREGKEGRENEGKQGEGGSKRDEVVKFFVYQIFFFILVSFANVLLFFIYIFFFLT